MSTYNDTFRNAYDGLNPAQKAAVDQIDGPVMVIAGPGTGKTQILSVRIAKILKETDTQPHNILCLTFTEAGVIAMRKRLVKIIGPDGHKVNINTFHGFCNQVIQENLDIFGGYRQLEQLTDLEKVDVYDEIMTKLPTDHILKKLKGDPSYEKRRLENLFDVMKKENLTAEDVGERIQQYYDYLENLDKELQPELFQKYIYSKNGKNYSAGDKKPEWQKLVRKMEELQAGADLLAEYMSIMNRMGRYDYADMILWVIRRFEVDQDLLMSYQERFQYFLVDEYQDTNGAQNALLEQLISYWEESPNVFVVGDDDQAIYRFQGANIGNIFDFQQKYNPNVVVLTQNYRSSQRILDLAKVFIDNNTERLSKQNKAYDKNLIASGKDVADYPTRPKLKVYPNVAHERADIIHRIEQAYKDGKDLSKTAVIARNHRQINAIVEVLDKKGIPLNVKKKVDILKLPLIRSILTIMQYISVESTYTQEAEMLLFEMMHYHFFPISSHDISKIMLYSQTKDAEDKYPKLKDIIQDEALLKAMKLSTVGAITELNDNLDKWTADIHNVTLQVLFENIINEGHVLQYVLNQPDKTWKLQVLTTLFDVIKNETKKQPDLKLKDFLIMIEKMEANNISLEINKIMHSERGIHFITAHSAKGLEFDHVIIPDVTKRVWDKKPSNQGRFHFPNTINEDVDGNMEDERRLLFVGQTRAERILEISYSQAGEDGKPTDQSMFISEMVETGTMDVEEIQVSEDILVDYQAATLTQLKRDIVMIDHDEIDRVLHGYKLSVTALNKYLKCPWTFYFETILRVPTARTASMGFGKAIHTALEYFYKKKNETDQIAVEELLRYFDMGMDDVRSHFTLEEYENLTAYGHQILTAYYDEYLRDLPKLPIRYAYEEVITDVEHMGVPLKGVLDRVDVYRDHVEVTDYKTGKFKSPKMRAKGAVIGRSKKEDAPVDEVGGDQWRQIVFYRMLLDSDTQRGWSMTKGTMDFVEPDRKTGEFTRRPHVVNPDDIESVSEQIVSVWRNIHDHKFDTGCGEEYCRWCNFVQNDYVSIGEDEGER